MKKIETIIMTAGILIEGDEIANLQKFCNLSKYDNVLGKKMLIKRGGFGYSLPWYIGKLDMFRSDSLSFDSAAMALFGNPYDDDVYDEILETGYTPSIILGSNKGITNDSINAMILSRKATHIKLNMNVTIRYGALCKLSDESITWIFGQEDLIER